jgi:hypothetical protein
MKATNIGKLGWIPDFTRIIERGRMGKVFVSGYRINDKFIAEDITAAVCEKALIRH